MSDTVQNVFHEYTRLRLNGLDASEAVRALHPHVENLDEAMREELASNMRAWENQRTEKVSFVDRAKLAKAAAARDADETIDCPTCGKANVARDEICYSCGALLSTSSLNVTDILLPETDEFGVPNDALFAANFVLLLMPDSGDEAFTLRPQLGTARLTIGRARSQTDDVDVDLERVGASQNGVSRLHAAIVYDEVSETLSLFDLGSTNGSYINGQKLHANERRAIRHGDQLRFGRLSFRVVYKTDTG